MCGKAPAHHVREHGEKKKDGSSARSSAGVGGEGNRHLSNDTNHHAILVCLVSTSYQAGEWLLMKGYTRKR